MRNRNSADCKHSCDRFYMGKRNRKLQEFHIVLKLLAQERIKFLLHRRETMFSLVTFQRQNFKSGLIMVTKIFDIFKLLRIKFSSLNDTDDNIRTKTT